jgi:hypothetical protein
MGGTGDHVKQNESYSERQIHHTFFHMQKLDLKGKMDMNIMGYYLEEGKQ